VKAVKHGFLQRVLASPLAETEPSVEIVFKPDHAPSFSLEYPVEGENRGKGVLNFIGDAVSGRIYPDGYFPASREKWLIGQKARLITYGDGAQFEGLKVLWLDSGKSVR
jgi:hypothetical protein